MYLALTLCAVVVYLPNRAKSLPSDACFQPFKWQDCGRPPQPVMYYWKPGSRCEVGFWRGCVPNLNMFKDEYECVAACIFAPRAKPIDFHSLNELKYEDSVEDDDTTTDDFDITTGLTTYDDEIEESVTENDITNNGEDDVSGAT